MLNMNVKWYRASKSEDHKNLFPSKDVKVYIVHLSFTFFVLNFC